VKVVDDISIYILFAIDFHSGSDSLHEELNNAMMNLRKEDINDAENRESGHLKTGEVP